MTICDLCLDHTKRRFKVDGSKLYYITNLTPTMLKSMSDDELLTIYKWIKDGVMICGDCEKLCSIGDSSCMQHHHKNRPAYKQRTMTDKLDLTKIEEEVARRTRMRRALRK